MTCDVAKYTNSPNFIVICVANVVIEFIFKEYCFQVWGYNFSILRKAKKERQIRRNEDYDKV